MVSSRSKSQKQVQQEAGAEACVRTISKGHILQVVSISRSHIQQVATAERATKSCGQKQKKHKQMPHTAEARATQMVAVARLSSQSAVARAMFQKQKDQRQHWGQASRS